MGRWRKPASQEDSGGEAERYEGGRYGKRFDAALTPTGPTSLVHWIVRAHEAENDVATPSEELRPHRRQRVAVERDQRHEALHVAAVQTRHDQDDHVELRHDEQPLPAEAEADRPIDLAPVQQ